MTKLEKIAEAIKDFSDSDLLDAWRTYCEANNYYDDEIYFMSEFDDLCCGMSPTEIIDRYAGDDFNTRDNYFVFTIYGATSFDYVDEAPNFDYSALADYCLQNDEDFDCDEIRDILDEEEEEE